MEREFVAQRVANSLHQAEAEVEAALARASALLNEMYAAKRELGLAGPVGADETAGVGRAIAALQTAHDELVGTHHGLNVLGRALKLRTKAAGWKPFQAAATAEKVAAA